jgi:hypothetical protein
MGLFEFAAEQGINAWKDHKAKKQRIVEQHEAQARRVTAWVEVCVDPDDDPAPHIMTTKVQIHVLNRSDEPISRLSATVSEILDQHNSPINIAASNGAYHPTLPPGQTVAMEMHVQHYHQLPRSGEYTLLFTDAAGVSWRRTSAPNELIEDAGPAHFHRPKDGGAFYGW